MPKLGRAVARCRGEIVDPTGFAWCLRELGKVLRGRQRLPARTGIPAVRFSEWTRTPGKRRELSLSHYWALRWLAAGELGKIEGAYLRWREQWDASLKPPQEGGWVRRHAGGAVYDFTGTKLEVVIEPKSGERWLKVTTEEPEALSFSFPTMDQVKRGGGWTKREGEGQPGREEGLRLAGRPRPQATRRPDLAVIDKLRSLTSGVKYRVRKATAERMEGLSDPTIALTNEKGRWYIIRLP